MTGAVKGLRFAAVPAGRPCGPPLTAPRIVVVGLAARQVGTCVGSVAWRSGRGTMADLLAAGGELVVFIDQLEVLTHDAGG
jgi:hypothetical protein